MNTLRIHGGRIDFAAVRYPDAPRPWLDLSTGINSVAWTPAPELAVDVTTLPSPDAILALEAAAADMFGTRPDRVVALPGSEIGLRLLDGLDLPAPVHYAVPSYGTHREAIAGAVPVARAAINEIDGGTLILANPNNPDGIRDTPARLLALLGRGGWLVVDEAFADATPESSIAPVLGDDDRAIVFRSFGKFFGLPGVRLGFMIAPPGQVTAMRGRLGSWPISAHAAAYGIAAYRDTDWIAQARIAIAARAARLDALLADHGLVAQGDCPLFRLVESDAAAVLFERLACAGILSRPFDYAPRWLRLGVPGSDAGFARLERALAHG